MEEVTVCVEEIEESQTISRTEAPDNTIKFWKFENHYVKDEYGNDVRFGDLYRDQRTVIVFLRVCLS